VIARDRVIGRAKLTVELLVEGRHAACRQSSQYLGGGKMIRKLKSGEYRLYSRKKNPKTGKRRNLVLFQAWKKPRRMSAQFNTLNAIRGEEDAE
jgi:hypothetical protein